MEKFDEVPSLFGAYNYPKVSVFLLCQYDGEILCLTWHALQKPHNIYHIEVVLFSSSLCFRLKKFWRRRKNQVKVTN